MQISGKMKVKTLKKQFLEEFGLSLRVFAGNTFADDEASLSSIRKKECKGGGLSVKRNIKVGNLEKNFLNCMG